MVNAAPTPRRLVQRRAGSSGIRSAARAREWVTKLVNANALKHAFPSEKMKGQIIITYEVDGTNWKLSVADNGVGKPDGVFAQPETGLGALTTLAAVRPKSRSRRLSLPMVAAKTGDPPLPTAALTAVRFDRELRVIKHHWHKPIPAIIGAATSLVNDAQIFNQATYSDGELGAYLSGGQAGAAHPSRDDQSFAR
jgi:hypothetical protein